MTYFNNVESPWTKQMETLNNELEELEKAHNRKVRNWSIAFLILNVVFIILHSIRLKYSLFVTAGDEPYVIGAICIHSISVLFFLGMIVRVPKRWEEWKDEQKAKRIAKEIDRLL